MEDSTVLVYNIFGLNYPPPHLCVAFDSVLSFVYFPRLRAMFGTDVLHNAVHGCSNKEQAQHKIEAVFGSLEFNPDGTVRGIN